MPSKKIDEVGVVYFENVTYGHSKFYSEHETEAVCVPGKKIE